MIYNRHDFERRFFTFFATQWRQKGHNVSFGMRYNLYVLIYHIQVHIYMQI